MFDCSLLPHAFPYFRLLATPFPWLFLGYLLVFENEKGETATEACRQGNQWDIKQQQGKTGEHTRMQGKARKNKTRYCFSLVLPAFHRFPMLLLASIALPCFCFLSLFLFKRERRGGTATKMQGKTIENKRNHCFAFTFACFPLHSPASACIICFPLLLLTIFVSP